MHAVAASVREAEGEKHIPDSSDLMGSLKIQTCQKSTVGVLLQVKSEGGMRGRGEEGSDSERERSERHERKIREKDVFISLLFFLSPPSRMRVKSGTL